MLEEGCCRNAQIWHNQRPYPYAAAVSTDCRRLNMLRTLYDKLWDSHVVRADADGTTVLYIDRHLVHEVTSPQAFEGLRVAGRPLWRTSANLAVADHNVPTTDRREGRSEE